MIRPVAIDRHAPHVLDYLRAITSPHPNAATEAILAHGRKAAVPGVTTVSDDHSALAAYAGVDVLRTMIERRLVPSRIAGAARIAFRTPTPFQTDPSASAWWRSEGSGKGATPWKAVSVDLPVRTVAALSVVSRETLRHASPETEAAVFRILSSAVAARANETLLGVAPAVPGESPASLSDSATSVPEGADVRETVYNMVEAASDADTDLTAATWIMSPETAVQAAAAFGTDRLGLTGGVLLTAPVLVDRAAGDRVFLLDGSRFAYALDGPTVSSAEHASIEMDTDPSGSSATPTAANLVSMYQTNSVALLSEIAVNWHVLGEAAFVAGEGS